jgi:hypothetical protein
MQKRASGGAGVPQFAQRRSRRVPHAMQNWALAGFSVPQALQFMNRDYLSWSAALCDATHTSRQPT